MPQEKFAVAADQFAPIATAHCEVGEHRDVLAGIVRASVTTMANTATNTLQSTWDCRWSRPEYRMIGGDNDLQPDEVEICAFPRPTNLLTFAQMMDVSRQGEVVLEER